MHSIKVRLLIWILFALLLVLGATGFASYRSTLALEEQDYQALKDGLKQRLALSLPHGVWQLDDEFIRLTLDAELESAAVVGMRVEGDAGLYLGRQNLPDGRVVNLKKDETVKADESMVLPVLYQQRDNLGNVTIYLSRARINDRIESEILRQVMQAVLVAISLSIILMLLLRGSRLEANENIMLPEARFSEFSELVHGVNAITQKISKELVLRRDAESGALEQKERAESAYQQLLDTQDTLIRTEKLASLGGLVAGVAHEINTPVGITLTAASHLSLATQQIVSQFSSGQIKKSELQDYLQNAEESSALILSNAERAANLIHSFKQVAVDQTSEARRTFDLNEYLHEVITSLRPKLRRSHIQVEIDCPEGLDMDSFPGALSQVVTNLVMNALLHAYDEEQEGTILLKADALSGNRVRLLVSDDGRGIPKDNLERIFEPFFTTKRGNGGSGLGLHIVFNIVFKRLGGNITVDSMVGEGTRFTVTLPCVAPEQQA